ncbi:HTH domain-containing protein [Leptobacterium sp. I13]|uniref:HTH domain-containing protein n=1 Tax=Leptobacterium meishanense TaxID=3128904 RepID=UPI0030EB34DE
MKTLKTLENLQQLHNLIKNGATGTPAELAKQMHISERMVYRLMDMLKDMKAPIQYDRTNYTYTYINDFDMRVNISVQILHNDEVVNIYGGSYFSAKKWFTEQIVQGTLLY